MPGGLRILDAELDRAWADAAAVLFEYVAMTQSESGAAAPDSVAELPGRLRAECAQPELAYAPPGVLLLAYVDDAVAGCVGLHPLAAQGTTGPDRPRWSGSTCGRPPFNRLVLDVMPNRLEAIAFYRRLGYTDTEPYADSGTPMVYLEHPIGPVGPVRLTV